MNHKLIFSDIKNNKVQSTVTAFFFGISVFVISLTVLLFTSLLGSINNLTKCAQIPDYLQMHSGNLDEEAIKSFAESSDDVADYQILRFLNLDNAVLSLAGKSMSENTQDNGLQIQSDRFDYLINMNNEIATVKKGEVYVPVCYKSMYDVKISDELKIGEITLKVAGFIRDAQMNSMMASSKRFLVSKEDYSLLSEFGNEEYLIEFRLSDSADINEFTSEYTANNLPNNGPAITASLIKLMNALSDGLLILIILIVSIVILCISLICIKFIMMTGLERAKREAGLLKAIGISDKEIRTVYSGKFVILSVAGMIAGTLMSVIVSGFLSKNIRELYGPSDSTATVILWTMGAALLTELICLLSVRKQIKKLEKMSAIQVLYDDNIFKNKRKSQYLLIAFVTAASVFLMILPENLKTTIAAPDFVSYMGIGNAEVRFDLRQCSDIDKKAALVREILSSDNRVVKSVSLSTSSVPFMTSSISQDGEMSQVILTTEFGNHSIFPVKYTKGKEPVNDKEIALSILNAKDLGLGVGDSVSDVNGNSYTVCGLYSDITNGGKTSKACFEYDGDVIWNIFYLSLDDSVSSKEWIEEMNRVFKEQGIDGLEITLIDEYVQGTYGPTINAIGRAALISKLVALIVMFVVVALFLTLLAEQERMQISLKKALGVSSSQINKEFVKMFAIYPVAGIIIGVFAGCILGQGVIGMILKSFGAGSFKFVLSYVMTFAVIPALTVIVLALATAVAIKTINNINATECVLFRE